METPDPPPLPDALAARSGLVAVVGAGGKKTTLYALASRLDRAILTATVRIPIFDRQVTKVFVTDDPVATVREASAWPLGLVPEREREDRYLGYEPEAVDALAGADVTESVLVKADGARTRLLKAPDEHEPQIPSTVDTVLPVASVQAVGKPLIDEYVHRPERVSAITDRSVGDEIRPRDVARVLTSEAGGLKGVPEAATVVAVLNMVDDAEDLDSAREIAERVVAEPRIDAVALTSMIAEKPVQELYR
ncbi:selenium cofactor biosynthesis protein YqeC [Natranaeroarchaeum aerophilus]|uniref:Selenium-dependent hydroxylase accessory protein YqeC n=1 Tax=Natranaeroarchaeum aerophilus TaxID=2917711 RepID=A0AAE3FR03_9EURY|nr:selenium cofactor biosynthesis protein YqeC [Natranaeroarchaeum aerophilus]MCL9814057.1 putative selenium-dependent hydroxylase accessory protein YqeC [Natranaeroarchaeum aerophilus]